MARLSGAARRKLKRGWVSQFTPGEIDEHRNGELAEQRKVLAAQRELSAIRRERARHRPLAESGEVLLIQYAGVSLTKGTA